MGAFPAQQYTPGVAAPGIFREGYVPAEHGTHPGKENIQYIFETPEHGQCQAGPFARSRRVRRAVAA
jgi:hypothetical protein